MIDSPLLTLIGIALVALVFFAIYVLPMRRSRAERGGTLLYEERCSGRANSGLGLWLGGNIPNWRISFYERFLVISSVGQTTVPYEEIQSVEYGRQLISKGIRVRAREPRLDIILFPKEPAKVLELFENKKVRVNRS